MENGLQFSLGIICYLISNIMKVLHDKKSRLMKIIWLVIGQYLCFLPKFSCGRAFFTYIRNTLGQRLDFSYGTLKMIFLVSHRVPLTKKVVTFWKKWNSIFHPHPPSTLMLLFLFFIFLLNYRPETWFRGHLSVILL